MVEPFTDANQNISEQTQTKKMLRIIRIIIKKKKKKHFVKKIIIGIKSSDTASTWTTKFAREIECWGASSTIRYLNNLEIEYLLDISGLSFCYWQKYPEKLSYFFQAKVPKEGR